MPHSGTFGIASSLPGLCRMHRYRTCVAAVSIGVETHHPGIRCTSMSAKRCPTCSTFPCNGLVTGSRFVKAAEYFDTSSRIAQETLDSGLHDTHGNRFGGRCYCLSKLFAGATRIAIARQKQRQTGMCLRNNTCLRD